jgi:hypothetical protein
MVIARSFIQAAAFAVVVAGVAVSAGGQGKQSAGQTAGQNKEQDSKQRPRLNLRAQPPVGITPARIVLSAELVGGSDDFEEYYCPTVEWEWGDDTRSESTSDCAPYEAGKSEIKRRYTVEHTFRRAGAFKVYIRLKHRDKEVAASSTNVQIQPGAQERY